MASSKNSSSSKSAWMSVAVLTVVFVAAFFVLRSLPDAKCGFLHYVEIVNEDGEIELCATNHAGFVDLTQFTYPIRVDLKPDADLSVSQSAIIDLKLKTDGGMSIAPHELAVTHTEKMHVMVIDESLEDYHHVHPKPDGIDGLYRFEFEPAKSGNYRVFTEIVPQRSRRQALALSSLTVSGEGSAPRFETNTISEVDGVRFELRSVGGEVQAKRDYRFKLHITDLEGEPIMLETVMGAKGHMVAFDEAGRGFAHMHPEDSVAAIRSAGIDLPEKGDEDLAFMFNVPHPGWYRLFAQIQLEGKPVFGRFDLKVL